MNQFNSTNVAGGVQTDTGLAEFLKGTYRYMAMAMAVTATVAFFTGQAVMNGTIPASLIFNPVVGIASFLIIVFGFGAVGKKLPSMSQGGVLAFLFGFAAFMGVLMSAYATAAYDPTIVAKIFFMTVAMFGALSLFGYTTNFNLSGVVKYAFAALFGVIAISIVGMFVPALDIFAGGTMGTVISVVGLLAVAVIAAWETQHLKRVYYAYANDASMKGKMQAFGAASLLLTFINMFTFLMNIFGRD
jgi:FtsH-binding integral membrane protein